MLEKSVILSCEPCAICVSGRFSVPHRYSPWLLLWRLSPLFLVVVNIEQLAQRWTREIQIIAYLQKAPGQQQLEQQLQQLKAFQEVDSVSYISQKEAFNRFRDRLGEEASLLDGIDSEILPASFELSIKPEFRNQEGIDRIIERLENTLEIDDLRYGQTWLERFNSFINMLRFVGLILGGFLLLAALFIVSNTIKLTLYARRDELEIMALVGATMRFIKVPFLLEGAIQGLLGGVISLVFLALSFTFIIARSLESFWLTPTDFNLLFLTAGQQLILVLSGVVLGTLGSMSSLRRFVKI